MKKRRRMHYTSQLQKIGRMDTDISSNNFLGVFPADKIPVQDMKRSNFFCCIANTDASDKPGQHWVAFICLKGKRIFFDSYGKHPSYYNSFWADFDSWTASEMEIQQEDSDVCGDYCIFFLKFASSNADFSLSKFYRYFDSDGKEENDNLVFQICHSLYPRILNSVGHDIDGDGHYDPVLKNSCNQGCKPRR